MKFTNTFQLIHKDSMYIYFACTKLELLVQAAQKTSKPPTMLHTNW